MYYTYMIRCSDNSIYTGMTNNLERRIEEHITKDKRGSNPFSFSSMNTNKGKEQQEETLVNIFA